MASEKQRKNKGDRDERGRVVSYQPQALQERAERQETPKGYEWRHSLTEKKQAEAYAEDKRKAEQRQSDS